MLRELVGLPTAAAEGRVARTATTPCRDLHALWAASVLGGLGQSLAGTAGVLLARQVGGSASVAGLPQACLVAGAAVSALALSKLTVRRGRRVALSTGTVVAVLGCMVVAGGAALASLSLILFGSGLLGAGNTAVMLGRYAAADLGPEVSRARLMASVLMATTFGAVAGPNMLAPASDLAAGLGLPPLAGPYLVASVSFSAAAGTLAVGLRSRPTWSRTAAAGGMPRSARTRSIPWSRSGLVGLVVLGVTNLVMVSVMTMTPVRMGEVGSGLPAIGLVVSLHVAGMFGPSPLSSWLTGRVGAARTAGCAGAVLIVACCLAASARTWPALAVAVALLGIGWNLSLVSGSTLLTADVPPTQRPHREGRGEAATGAAAAGGGAAAGPVMAGGGYWLLATGAAVVAALVLPVIRARTATSVPGPRRTTPVTAAMDSCPSPTGGDRP